MKPKFQDADIDGCIRSAEKMANKCSLCEHRCGIDRKRGKGACGVSEAWISSYFLHYGEEREIVPSFTVFFSGCNFGCVYCQNWDISQFPDKGERISPEELARVIDNAFKDKARNVNFVGGEPTPNLVFVLEVLKRMREPAPVIWNSNFYMTKRCMKILDKVVDIYLSDFKYGNNECARRLSNVDNYFEVVSRNHRIAKGKLIIRHLVLPNHVDCCTFPILDWIAENLENDYCVNLMDQYRPMYKANDHREINRPLKKQEFERAKSYANRLGINQC